MDKEEMIMSLKGVKGILDCMLDIERSGVIPEGIEFSVFLLIKELTRVIESLELEVYSEEKELRAG